MTNLVGKWKVSHMLFFNDKTDRMELMTAEDILAGDDVDRDMIMMLSSIVEFDEDGTWRMLNPLPEGVSQEEVDAAVAAGKIRLKDGLMFFDERKWKVEDGVNYTDTMPEGEVMGEKTGPWEKVTEFEDGSIGFLFYRLARI